MLNELTVATEYLLRMITDRRDDSRRSLLAALPLQCLSALVRRPQLALAKHRSGPMLLSDRLSIYYYLSTTIFY